MRSLRNMKSMKQRFTGVLMMMMMMTTRSSIFYCWIGSSGVSVVAAVARGSTASATIRTASVATTSNTATEECRTRPDGSTTCSTRSLNSMARGGSTRPSPSNNHMICQDEAPDCSDRAQDNGCIFDFVNMRQDCQQTCLLCDNRYGNHYYALFNEKPQDIPLADSTAATLRVLQQTETYMYDLIYMTEDMEESTVACTNRHESCSFWSAKGECENNPLFMHVNCAPACQTCQKIIFEQRCPVDDALLQTSVWGKRGLHQMFESIVQNPEWQAYNLQILSQPQPSADHILEGPWVITLDDFLSPDECDAFIALGAQNGYERSQDLSDEMNLDGTFDGVVSEERTSTNSWCDGPCADHEVTRAVHSRMEKLTGIPRINYEDLQLLRYEVGQKYGVHHDYIESQAERQPGARILTVFLYLNDVEAGGGTNFPELDLTVQPKRGRALLWPSVLDEDPDEIDPRTDHQALAVEAGTKYGANAWVHLRDFKTPHEQNCH